MRQSQTEFPDFDLEHARVQSVQSSFPCIESVSARETMLNSALSSALLFPAEEREYQLAKVLHPLIRDKLRPTSAHPLPGRPWLPLEPG